MKFPKEEEEESNLINQCDKLQSSKVNVNSFLDTLMNDPCPPCLMWLPLLHRMASVEHVYHPVVCDGCGVESFTGFRFGRGYRIQVQEGYRIQVRGGGGIHKLQGNFAHNLLRL